MPGEWLLGCGCRRRCCCRQDTPPPVDDLGGNLFQQSGRSPPRPPVPEESPFIPVKPVDFAPLRYWGAGMIADVGANAPVVHVGVKPGGQSDLSAAPGDPIGTQLRAAAQGLGLPFPLHEPHIPLLGDTPYSQVEIIASTVADPYVLILATVTYHMPAFDPTYDPNVRKGWAPIYIAGLYEPLDMTFMVTATANVQAPDGMSVPWPEKGVPPLAAPPHWIALTGGHVSHPLTLDALIQMPFIHGSAMNTHPIISSEQGRITVLTNLHYLQRSDPYAHAYYWRRIEVTSGSISVTDTPAVTAWLPNPVPEPTGVAPLWSGQTPQGAEVLGVQFTGSGGQAAQQAFSFAGGTPTLMGPGKIYPSTEVTPVHMSHYHHNPVVNGQVLFPRINWGFGPPHGGTWDVGSGEWTQDVLLSGKLMFYDLRDMLLHKDTPLDLYRAGAGLTASQPARVGSGLIGKRTRLYATNSHRLREGDKVTLGGVAHNVIGSAGTAFEVYPEVPFTLDKGDGIPHQPWNTALTWSGQPETFPAAMHNPSFLPAQWIFPTAHNATPATEPRIPGRWQGKVESLPGVDLDHQRTTQRRPRVTARPGDALALSFPAVTPSPVGAVILLTARAPQGGTLTLSRAGALPVVQQLSRRWTQYRIPFDVRGMGTLTLTASAATQLSVVAIEQDATS